MELILVRHGLPERDNSSADPPLTSEGRQQAAQVAAHLAGERIDAIYSSTMIRAVQTAEPFAAQTGHPIHKRAGIIEFDRELGRYVPMEELKRTDYPAWQAFVNGGLNVDLEHFQRSVVDTLEEIVATHANQRVAAFCHGGVINVWTAHVLGFAPRLFFEPAYTSISRYLCARSGQRNLVSLNERAHGAFAANP